MAEVAERSLGQLVADLVLRLVAERDQARADLAQARTDLATFARIMHAEADTEGLCDEYDEVVASANSQMVNQVVARR